MWTEEPDSETLSGDSIQKHGGPGGGVPGAGSGGQSPKKRGKNIFFPPNIKIFLNFSAKPIITQELKIGN